MALKKNFNKTLPDSTVAVQIDPSGKPLIIGHYEIAWQPDSLPGEALTYGKQWQFLSSNADLVGIDGGKGSGKRLWIDTNLPTPTGWIKMGDVKVGDKLFDEGGNVCSVTYVSPVGLGDSFRIVFSDGNFIFADSDHLWSIETQEARLCGREPRVMNTQTIRAHILHQKDKSTASKFSIRNAMPLNLPTAELPLDPYFFGLWLGDGNSRSAIITTGEEDKEFVASQLELAQLPFTRLKTKTGRAPQFYVLGKKKTLKNMNVLLNKHIPPVYLRSSESQRLALLQGLMDSDGSAQNGQGEFYNTNLRLINDVMELVVSLGMKCTMTSKKSKLYGKEYGLVYTARFTATLPVFRLSRKLKNIKLGSERELRRYRRYINSVEPIDSLPMRCIAVDSPSHLYLAGKEMIPTHNTDLLLMDTMRIEKLTHPLWHGVIFRREYKRLMEVIERAHYWFKRMPGWKAHWQGDRSRFIFPSGAWLAFHNCEYVDDVKQYQGWQICDLKFDQLEEFLEKQFDFLCLQNRNGDPEKLKNTVKWTANPVGVGRCVPFGEVLTRNGWKQIQDVTVGELVATIDDGGFIVFAPVEQVHSEFFSGNLLAHKTVTSFMLCTPDHKIARRTETKRKNGRTIHSRILLTKAKDIPKEIRLISSGTWLGTTIGEFTVPPIISRKLKLQQPETVSGDDFCRFMGWFLSEGYTLDRDKEFGICQSKVENRREIESLLNKMGFSFRTSVATLPGRKEKAVFTVSSPNWWAYLRQFGKADEKFIPAIIKDATPVQLRMFVDTAMKGDGDKRQRYYTTSRRLADDMQEVILKMGCNARLSSRRRQNRTSTAYEVQLRKSKHFYAVKRKFVPVQFDGTVYCLGVKDYHTFLLRQNGIVWLSGNSWVKKRFVDDKEPGKIYNLDVEVNGEILTKTYERVFATIFDNPQLSRDKKYIATLASEPNPYLRKALFEGSWDSVVGMFFSEFVRNIHVIPSIDIDPKFRRLAGCDYGNYKAIEFLARDYVGNIYVEWEYYSHPNENHPQGETATEFAENSAKFMLARGIGEGMRIVGDTNMWSATGRDVGSEKTPARIIQDIWNAKFKEAGKKYPPYLTVVSKRTTEEYRYRIACNEAVRDFLHYEVDTKGNLVKGKEPRLYLLQRCQAIIECMSNLVCDESDPLDIDSTQEDHVYDAMKMALMELRNSTAEVPIDFPKTEDEYLQKFVFKKKYDRLFNPVKLWHQR